MSIEHSPAKQSRIISRREFRKRFGDISRTTEFRLRESDPTFPKVVWVSAGKSGYFEDEATSYIRSRPRHQGPDDELPAEAPSAVNGKPRRGRQRMPDVWSPP